MRITVVHNAKAGYGILSREELLGELEWGGHEVTEVTELDRLKEPSFAKTCDAVIAAGGDGTVLSVARRLLFSSVPMVVLPLGTANNFAHAVGMTRNAAMGGLRPLIASLHLAPERRIDVGRAEGTWGTRYFCESAGVGWFCEALTEAIADGDKPPTRARDVLTDYLSRYQAKYWDVSIDGHNCSGAYLMIDVMNAGMLGPNLKIGHSADPTDGAFDVVMATAEDQPKLLRYLEALRRDESPTPPELYVRRGRHVRFAMGNRKMRIDGKVRHSSPFVDIHVVPGSVRLLVPEAASEEKKAASNADAQAYEAAV